MPTGNDYFSAGYRGRHRRQRGSEVAGPYRSQSSNPAIRAEASPREHRRVNPFIGVAFPPILQAPDLAHPLAAPAVPHAVLANLLATPTRLEDPYTAYSMAALHGVTPPAILKREYDREYGPELYNRITRAAIQNWRSKENLKEDPLAEFAISTLATAGLGLGVNALRGAGDAAAASALEAGGVSAGRSASRRALEGLWSLRSAAGREAAAQRLRAAPADLRDALVRTATTPEGRRAAGKAAGAQFQSHPLAGATGALTALHRAGIEVPLARQADALTSGTLAAALHPARTIPTTGRALAGAVAAPAALLYSGGDSLIHGDPRPFLNTAQGQVQGLAEIGSNLLSGDAARVQKSVEDEAGLYFLPAMAVLGRLDRYAHLRSALRERAKGLRSEISDRTGLPLRHGPGEQHVLALLERHAQRKDVAKMVADTTLPARVRAAQYERPIVRGARKAPLARSLRNLHSPEGGDLIQAIADYGLTPQRWREQIAYLREHGPVSEVPARRGDVNLRTVVDLAQRHPEILDSPHLWRAVDAYRAQVEHLPANRAGNGRRAAALPQGQLFGIRPPEERVPHAARKYTDAPDRAGAWRDVADLRKQALDLRHQGRGQAYRSAEARRHGDHEEAASTRAHSEELYRQAHEVEAREVALKKALGSFTRPGQAVSSRARRKLWDQPLLNEYVEEVNAKAAEQGFAPGVYTHHAPIRQEGEIAPQARYGNAATRVQHVRRADEFSLAATDTVDRSLRGLLAGSVEGPRVRAAGQALARRFFSKYSTPLRIEGKVRRRMTQGQFAQAIRDGQVSEQHYVWVPEAQYKQAYVDPNVSPERYAAEAHAVLRGEVVDAAVKGQAGAKGVVVPKEAFKEYAAQISPVRGVASRVVDAASKTAGRVLLFSPAWIASQVIAEGLPIVMSNPRLLNPAYWAKLERRLKQWNDVSPDEAMGFAATMGEAPVRAATPNELRPFQSSRAHQLFYDGARAIERNPIGRAVFSTARLRPFVLFDQWRHGKYQKILAAAEVDRRLNGFLAGLQGALVHEKRLSEELRGMSPQEQLHALTQPRYRRDLEKIQGYVEGITGNWTAFTRFERAFSPAAVFYGFIRYAFRWPLTFAREHPISATVNYFLAQQNANQIEKVLGGKPTDFYKFANPVVQDAQGKSNVLPGGSRIAPGLSAPSQAVLQGNAPQAVVGSLNPFYGALYGLASGTDSFGGHDENEGLLGLHWSLAARQLMTLPPLARFVGLGESHSETAEELHRNDPNRKLRSLVAPWLSQSGEGARANEEILRSIERYEREKKENGGYPPSRPSSSPAANPFESAGTSSVGNPFEGAGIGGGTTNPFLP